MATPSESQHELLKDATRNANNIKSVCAPTDKEVTISDEPEHIEPPSSYANDDSTAFSTPASRLHRASISGRKMTGRNERPGLKSTASSTSLSKQFPNINMESSDNLPGQNPDDYDENALFGQVMLWLQHERSKRSEDQSEQKGDEPTRSDQDLALDKLERILALHAQGSAFASRQYPSRVTGGIVSRRGSVARALLKASRIARGSDTDAVDTVAEVPHIEASLDNSKTMSYAGGAPDVSEDSQKSKEEKCWEVFKQDIVRLTHTLGLRGWRRLPIEYANAIHVERLSGALTNAVYVVKPPKDYTLMQRTDDQGNIIPIRKHPKQLLLRIYGPQVDHLIDRENELLILRRLAAKNIGPKLLGYFDNGRFEEFLNAITLRPKDLRDPSTSKNIAKRMKELHEGIDLLESEKRGGPFVFMNWDKWVDRVEQVITFLDQQVQDEENGKPPAKARYTRRGLVCGVEWKIFRNAYDKYRKQLIDQFGGESGVRKRLVFAHNDTQYGNLMKLQPQEKSPHLQGVNQHKQIVVIDFEYSSANTRGLEFVNHFTEWCYDYHDAERSYACNTNRYPTPEEQHRFVRSYVMHRPQFAASASSTPNIEAREKTTIPDFILDARAPPSGISSNYDEEEQAREKAQEKEIQKLLEETRLWRMANSAQWVAWGIVQAQVPELDKAPKKSVKDTVLDKVKSIVQAKSDPLDDDVKEKQEASEHDRPENRASEQAHHEGDGNQTGNAEEEEEEEFDYLAYSQERAMFFWGDCVQMGIVKESDLPERILSQIKYVKY